ncbi:MAG: MIP/aquaporin family protein [Demequina sp.]
MSEPDVGPGHPVTPVAVTPPAEDPFEQELDADVWKDEDLAGPSLIARMLAEAGGTFILVFLGVGTALFFSTGNNGTLTVGLSFAIAVVIAALVFGGVSGAHINPAVTLGLWLGGRFPGRDVVSYVIAQLIGAIAAGALLFALASSHPQIENGRELMNAGVNSYGDQSPLGFGLVAAAVVEVIIAALLVSVVLAVTSVRARAGAVAAPFAIGLTFGLLVVFATPFTSGALNPARSTGAALFAESAALGQLWVFWVAPLLGAAIAGLLFRAFGPEEDLLIVETVEEVEIVEA